MKRAYRGLGKLSEYIVQFDTATNRFLAAVDVFQVKFWDVDSVNLLTTFDAEGGLMVSTVYYLSVVFAKESSCCLN